jgi:hypothetical protein
LLPDFSAGIVACRVRVREEKMRKKRKSDSESECDVCYAAHDEEIHQATIRIRQWLSRQVNHRFDEEAAASE